MKKKFVMMFVAVLYVFATMGTSVLALWSPYTSTRKLYTEISTVEVGQEYSAWHRLNKVQGNFSRSGSRVGFMKEETETVTTTSSLGLSFPVKKVELSLGLDYTIENSKSYTTCFTLTDDLSYGEYAAYYYRNHWTVYDVTYRVTTVKYDPVRMRDGPVISSKMETKTIRVAQDFEPEDFKWIYKFNKSELGLEVGGGYCT